MPPTPICARRCLRRGRTMAGCRRRRPTIRRGLPRAAPSSSIRSTARAASSKASAPGASASRSSRAAARSPACSNARRSDETLLGAAGRGALQNGERIRVSGPAGEDTAESLAAPKPMIDLMPRAWLAASVRRVNMSLARLPAGHDRRRTARRARFVKPNAHDWDIAAADLILREAGGALARPRWPRAALCRRGSATARFAAGSGELLAVLAA